MIDWLIAQQGPLSVALILLITMEKTLTPSLGPKRAYYFWGFLPVVILLTNLPEQWTVAGSNTISRYTVGLMPSVSISTYSPYLLIWGLGVIAIAAFILMHYKSLNQSEIDDLDVQVSHNIHVKQNHKAIYSDIAATPMVFGMFTPRILLPLNFNSLYSSEQQSLILEHELVHLQRCDHLWNILALIIATLFWFNPLVWFGLRSFRTNQELACDQQVLKNKNKHERVSYAKALLLCAQHSSTHTLLHPTLGDKNTMLKRLTMMQKAQKPSKVITSVAIIVAALFSTNVVFAKFTESPKIDTEMFAATPIVRVEPNYPAQAAKDGVEGSVILQFDVTETGATNNISVIKSTPKGLFDESAVKALKKWKYKPRIQGGKAYAQEDMLVQLDFRLSLTSNGPSKNADVEKIKVVSH